MPVGTNSFSVPVDTMFNDYTWLGIPTSEGKALPLSHVPLSLATASFHYDGTAVETG